MEKNAHFCTLHNSKFYRNEKIEGTGQSKVWYSHEAPRMRVSSHSASQLADKKADGSGFCVEQDGQMSLLNTQSAKDGVLTLPSKNNVTGMYACNAMNNAVLLVCHGVVPVEQIGVHFKKILGELNKI